VYLFKETDKEDIRLVKECLAGSGRSYDKLVEKYYKVIFRLAVKLVRGFDDAEEITQIVFVKAYESLGSYSSKYKFFSWLYRITINESINHGKRLRNNEVISEELRSSNDSPDEMTEAIEMNNNIRDALMKLDIIYRVPVVLKHFEGYSYKELSEMLDIPEKTVKSRLFTGRQLLKDLLKHRV
jgi:RNA polymerase sigma-70 factor, ECF subfamily